MPQVPTPARARQIGARRTGVTDRKRSYLIKPPVNGHWWTPANFPEFHPGVFSSNLGVKIIIGTFVWHAVYFLQLTCFSDAFGKHQWKAKGISLKSIGLRN